MSDSIEAIVATELERLAYLGTLGDRNTAGPDEHPPVGPLKDVAPFWQSGLWIGARHVAAHPGRIGGSIAPMTIVDHTTDMADEDWDALIAAFSTRPGDGACCHFLVGKSEAQGVVQFVPVSRNGNHAGGPTHGVYVDDGHEIHPNLLAIGIEFHCAGGQLRMVGNQWRFVEDGKIHGAPLSGENVEPDPQRPGRGWQKLTPYQEYVRGRLHADLEMVLAPLRPGLRAVSKHEAAPAWAKARTSRIVGHVTLDAASRSDPWPPGMRALV